MMGDGIRCVQLYGLSEVHGANVGKMIDNLNKFGFLMNILHIVSGGAIESKGAANQAMIGMWVAYKDSL
jgi:hypothetical protein